MNRALAGLSAAMALALAACGGGPPPPPSTADPTAGMIAGAVQGTTWTSLANAYWAGKMVTGSPTVVIFLFERAFCETRASSRPHASESSGADTSAGSRRLVDAEEAARGW